MKITQLNPLGKDYDIPVKSFRFSGGETQVRIEKAMIGDYRIRADLRTADDIMELLMVKNAIDNHICNGFHVSSLMIPYVPYSRQDRVCYSGEALSIKVMADLINSMNFSRVMTFDNHSDVSTALINNCYNVTKRQIFRAYCHLFDPFKYDVIVAPDGGALKSVFEVGQELGVPVITAEKKRDTNTGDITHTVVHADKVEGNVLVVDDICDGGRTFIELAKVLEAKGVRNIDLYTTHGIYSKGIHALLNKFRHLFCTDSFQNASHPNLLKLSCEKVIRW